MASEHDSRSKCVRCCGSVTRSGGGVGHRRTAAPLERDDDWGGSGDRVLSMNYASSQKGRRERGPRLAARGTGSVWAQPYERPATCFAIEQREPSIRQPLPQAEPSLSITAEWFFLSEAKFNLAHKLFRVAPHIA